MKKYVNNYIALIISIFLSFTFFIVEKDFSIRIVVEIAFFVICYIFMIHKKFSESDNQLKKVVISTLIDYALSFIFFLVSLYIMRINRGISDFLMHFTIVYMLLKNVGFPSFGTIVIKSYYTNNDIIRFIENLFIVLPLYLLAILQNEMFVLKNKSEMQNIINILLTFNFIDILFFIVAKPKVRIIRYLISKRSNKDDL